MRASSWKNRRMRLPLCVSAISFSVCGALFKGLCSGRVFGRMARARALLPEGGKTGERVGADAAVLRIGPSQDRLRQLGLASRVELARAPRLGPVVEPCQAVLVVALDRIAPRLVGHSLP